MGREVVTELVQYDLTVKKVLSELKEILPDGNKRTSMLNDYNILREKLGGPGASVRIASEMVRLLNAPELR
jgi:lipid-A-disaccharide synthase